MESCPRHWRLRAPRIHSRIQKLQPHLSFLLRSRFADPYRLALGNIKWVFVCDDFDNLSALKFESPHVPRRSWQRRRQLRKRQSPKRIQNGGRRQEDNRRGNGGRTQGTGSGEKPKGGNGCIRTGGA